MRWDGSRGGAAGHGELGEELLDLRSCHTGRAGWPIVVEEGKRCAANALLLREGFHGVMRLDEVRRLERIPMLGTGKTDYKQLRAMIEEESRSGT